MRLTNEQVSIIRTTAQSVFGNSVQVFLFGSRTNDEKRGGDIDLLVQSAEHEVLNISNKINFIVELKRQLGDQKIDMVLSRIGESGSSIVQIARKTGIAVC
jgi:predicted nucleotidyltransferase